VKTVLVFALSVAAAAFPAGVLCAAEPPPAERAPEVYAQWPFDAAEARKRQKETAEKLGVPAEKAVDLGGARIELVLVPAGEFDMGSPAAEKLNYNESEMHVHRVRITKPFWMGKYELPQDAWEKVMGKNPSFYKNPRNPVERVSWNDCQEFLKKLNAAGRDKGAFRLPTEAEWEYACRAGTKTPFCFGETVSTDQANYYGEFFYGAGKAGVNRKKTVPVGSLPASPWGLCEMHGNVGEWCQDWFARDYYEKSPKDDPPGPANGAANALSGPTRVWRGGSLGSDPAVCRSANRCAAVPGDTSTNIGLRVVLTVAGL